jgi:hypothetical protein
VKQRFCAARLGLHDALCATLSFTHFLAYIFLHTFSFYKKENVLRKSPFQTFSINPFRVFGDVGVGGGSPTEKRLYQKNLWLTNGLGAVGVFSVSGGMLLFFTVSWPGRKEYQPGWLHADDYGVACACLRVPEPEDREASGCVSSDSKRYRTLYIPVERIVILQLKTWLTELAYIFRDGESRPKGFMNGAFRVDRCDSIRKNTRLRGYHMRIYFLLYFQERLLRTILMISRIRVV